MFKKTPLFINSKAGSAVIAELNVTPTTSAQTITAPEGTDGYNPVNVSAVTSSIDANIQAENIKKDVSILGVTGSYEAPTPTGTINITTNGTHDVSSYANADVNVPTTAPDFYIALTRSGNNLNKTGVVSIPSPYTINLGTRRFYYEWYQVSFPSTQNVDWSGITALQDYALNNAFNGSSNLGSVDLSNLTSIYANSMTYAFNGSSITSIDLSNLSYIGGTGAIQGCFSNCTALQSFAADKIVTISQGNGASSLCQGCTALTSFSMNKLESVTGSSALQNGCSGCTNLTSVDLSSLKTLSGSYCFNGFVYGCTKLESFSLNALNTITRADALSGASSLGRTFGGCKKLKNVYFGGLKSTTFSSIQTQLQYLFNSETGSTATGGCTLHFPSNFDPSDPNHTFDASTLAGYPTFGGDANYIHLAFDLPATE